MIGKVFNNRYKIIEKLGSGGTAIVYRGQDLLLNRMVTIKILREEYANNTDFIRRFRHEAQAVASLSHSNIVGVYDVGFEENMHYIVMEFVEGESLKDYIRRKGMIPGPEACDIATQILAGVQHAHEHGIIHRDLKSHNILMSKDGQAKVTDFGIAVGMSDVTLTYNTSSRIMGSVHYISPEQVQGQAVTEKSDIYSVGVIIYEMLTGRLPFLGETPISIAMQHVQGELILPHQLNPKISMAVSYVVMRAMRKNPDSRYAGAKEMTDALRAACESEMNGGSAADGAFSEDEGFKKALAVTKPAARNQKRTARPRQLNKKRVLILAGAGVLFIILMLVVGSLTGILGGGKTTEVPGVVGDMLSDAEAKMEDANLVVDAKYVTSDQESGIVLEQSVKEGEKVSVGRTITLTVSKGAATIPMPDLMGATRKIAELTLTNKNIKYNITEQYDEEKPRNEVIFQSPEAGVDIALDTVAELVVSLGPEPISIIMPNFLGQTLDEANPVIEENNFVILTTTYGVSYDYAEGEICEQSIAPGTPTKTGAELSLTVSEGPGPQSKTHNVRWAVTGDGGGHDVIIRISDADGTREVYHEQRDTGDVIEFSFNYSGRGTMEILLDGVVVRSSDLD